MFLSLFCLHDWLYFLGRFHLPDFTCILTDNYVAVFTGTSTEGLKITSVGKNCPATTRAHKYDVIEVSDVDNLYFRSTVVLSTVLVKT